MHKPRWGFFEIIVVYLGILVTGIIFSLKGEGWFYGLATHLPIQDSELNFFIFSFAIQFAATVLLVWLLTVVLYHSDWRELGLRAGRSRDYWLYGLLGGIGLLIAITLMGYIINYFQPNLQPQPYEAMLRSVSGPGQFLAILLVGAVLAPLSEELFYRGMMYPVFRKHLGPFWGAIVAGAVFGLSHWDLWRTIPLAIGGALLCYVYEKSGSIWVSALTHGVWNGIMSIIVYLSLFSV